MANKVKADQIGKINKQLCVDLKAGRAFSSGFPVADFKHPQLYNYDLSFGVAGCGSKALGGKYIGVKYYCYKNADEIDMAKRIVHIYDPGDREGTQKFYRLVHSKAAPGLNDNSYSQCEEIVDIP